MSQMTDGVVEFLRILNEIVTVDFPAADDSGKAFIIEELRQMEKRMAAVSDAAKAKNEEAIP